MEEDMKLCILVLAVVAGISSAFSWLVEAPDTSGETGYYTAIDIDSQGSIHIVYRSNSENSMKHIWQTPSGWEEETVFTGLCSFISMVLDDSDMPNIVFWNPADGMISHIRSNGSGWEVTPLESANISGYYSPRADIMLDSAGNPHIVWHDSTGERLRYGCMNGNEWEITTVDEGTDAGVDPSITIDDQDRLHVSYVKGDPGHVYYAFFDGSSWEIQELSVGGEAVGETSIALNSNGEPGISYHSLQSNQSLKYLYFDGTEWNSDVTYYLNYISPGTPNGLCFSSDDTPYISACRTDYQSFIMCLYKTGGTWQASYPEGSYTGWDSSICPDPYGYVHLAYQNMSNSDLSYATNNLTGIESESGSPEEPFFVNLFPNPSSGEITVQVGSGASGEVEVAIVDCAGRIVHHTMEYPNTGSTLETSFGGLTPGVYFCTISSHGSSVCRRFAVLD